MVRMIPSWSGWSMRSQLCGVAVTEQPIPPNRRKRATTELVAIQVMSILLLLIYPSTLRGVIPGVPALAGEMVQELPVPPFWIFIACFFSWSFFHDPTSILTHMRCFDEIGKESSCIIGWESFGEEEAFEGTFSPKIPSGTPVGPSLWMCDTCLLLKSSLWSTYFLLPHVFIFFSPFKYFLPLAVCDWTPWSLNSLGISPLL